MLARTCVQQLFAHKHSLSCPGVRVFQSRKTQRGRGPRGRSQPRKSRSGGPLPLSSWSFQVLVLSRYINSCLSAKTPCLIQSAKSKISVRVRCPVRADMLMAENCHCVDLDINKWCPIFGRDCDYYYYCELEVTAKE